MLYLVIRKGSAWLCLGAAIGLVLVAAVGGYPAALWLAAIAALGFALIWIGCFVKVRSYRFDLVPQGITLEKGLLSKSHETLLFVKIQDIVIRRSVLERLLGLSTLTIQNAMGQPESIPGMDSRAAMEFRDEILQRITSLDRAAR